MYISVWLKNRRSIMTLFYNRIGFMTLLMREVRRFMKVPIQTILSPLLSNILYLGIFGGMMRTRQVGVEGVNYLLFIVPGLATMGAIMAAFQNPSFSIISHKYQNTIQDLNSYPISNIEKSLAFILGGTIRGLLVGSLTYTATAIFVGFKIESPVDFFIMLCVTSFIFASLGLISGLLIESFERLNFMLSIVITPLSYLGGVFFEVSKLPGILSFFKFINPIFPLINITRYTYLGVSEGNILLHFIMVVVFVSGLFTTATITLAKGYGTKVT
ncbi:ABC transporter permease [Iocasia frigidifontis]|uniref:Transport permease protein n=2 Tax=Iocasia fonsfrigidae TaxID=2682810 RepID=A0A8A7KPE4_9FIRM|nr:ABC transporter permease [Iocasia fonsfrigidae]